MGLWEQILGKHTTDIYFLFHEIDNCKEKINEWYIF
ncbi:MAG: hypothetical protein ACI863_001027, partial [Flavobacteriales bacterium]